MLRPPGRYRRLTPAGRASGFTGVPGGRRHPSRLRPGCRRPARPPGLGASGADRTPRPGPPPQGLTGSPAPARRTHLRCRPRPRPRRSARPWRCPGTGRPLPPAAAPARLCGVPRADPASARPADGRRLPPLPCEAEGWRRGATPRTGDCAGAGPVRAACRAPRGRRPTRGEGRRGLLLRGR